MSRSKVTLFLYVWIGLVEINMQTKVEGFTSNSFEVIAKVKVFWTTKPTTPTTWRLELCE